MKYYTLLFLLVHTGSFATFFPSPIGSNSLALSGLYATCEDPFAAFNHPGIFSKTQKSSLSAYYQNQFYVEGLNYLGFCAQHADSSPHVFALSMGFIGNKFYNETIIKGSYATGLSPKIGAGISIDYLRLHFPSDNGSNLHKLTLEAGLLIQLSSNLQAALKVFNPTRTKLSNFQDERIPMLLSSSLIYKSNQHFQFYLEWNQIMNRMGNYHLAMTYEWSKQVSLNLGLSSNPMQFGLGVQFVKKKYLVSLAFLSHPYLKNISSSGMSYYPT